MWVMWPGPPNNLQCNFRRISKDCIHTYTSHNIRLHRLQLARLSLFDNLLVGLDTFAEKTVIIFSITENLKCR